MTAIPEPTQPKSGRPSPAPGRHWWRLLLPAPADVIELLVAQGEVSEEGLTAFEAWSSDGSPESAARVREAYHHAYDARRELLGALQAALSTPVDQEDLYVLSERMDRILVEAKNAVREAEVLEWHPDAHAASMATRIAGGTRALVAGLRLLRSDGEQAGREADAASDAVHHVERDYREAMAGLLATDELRSVLATQELYRRYLRVAEAIVAVADRLWYAVLRGA